MNEQDFGFKVRHYLNLSTEQIDDQIAERLFAARQKALAQQRVAAFSLSVPGIGQISESSLLPKLRRGLTVVLLALGVAGVSYWSSMEQAAEIEDLDSALLSDDLPINAYLDRGFDAWLKRTSQ